MPDTPVAGPFERAIALHKEGVVALQAGRLADGVDIVRQAIAIQANIPALHYTLAIGLHALGRHDEALASYDATIALQPDFADAHNHRGIVLRALHRIDDAIASHDRAIALRPDFADAFYQKGITLLLVRRHADAVASFDQTISLKPDFADALNNRGGALLVLQRPEDALADFDRAIVLNPQSFEAHGNRGSALRELGRPDDALASFNIALTLAPNHATGQFNRGNTLAALGRHHDAIASYNAAIAQQPHHALAQFRKACSLLSLGRFRDGWRQFEWRKRIEPSLSDLPLRQPVWLGNEPLAGRTLLVRAEGGFGDVIQFCRYLPLLATDAHIVLGVHPPLLRLLRSLRAPLTLVGPSDTLPPFDLHCPMLSLPLACDTTLATIPAELPYLRGDPSDAEPWRRRLNDLPGLRIGLCWAGGPTPALPVFQHSDRGMDRRRSITLARYAPLFAVPGVSVVSLQKGEAAAQTPGRAIHDWTAELTDFADTAALIEALDLVITVDTAVAHLAGALGKPVWILNRFDACWRWLTERTDSPWYPTARLFRQPAPGDWDSVIAEVAQALGQLVA